MIRSSIVLAAAVVFAAPLFAQQNCPNGRCPALVDLGPVPPAGMKAPSDRHEWKYLPDVKMHGWGFKDVPERKSVDSPMPEPKLVKGVPAPKFDGPNVAAAKHGQHGPLFYHTVRTHAYHQLVEKGYSRDKAKSLVEALSVESIDAYGAHVGISGKIGDGSFIQWIIDHKDQIVALIKLIVSLLAIAEAPTPDAPSYAWVDIEFWLTV